MRTLVVGAAIVDLMMKVERLPKSGEDIPCKETKTVVGGCAYNVANTLRNLKCEHDLCVPVGSGSFADIIRRGMKEKGYECIGITIKTFNETGDGIKRENTCCSLDDVSDARSVACTLGIRHFLYNFTGQNAEDYPRTQSMNSTSNSIMLPTNVLIDNISRSLFATASDELRPVMNGIYFDLTADALAIVASDGHKLVRNRNYTIKSETPASFILPKKPASLLKAILTRDSEDVEIKFDERSAEILFTDGEMKCRLIDGRYPNYNSVIPNNPNEVTVDRKALISALRRVMPFASESSQLVRFYIEPGKLEVSSEDMDFSTSARELLACEYVGSPINIGFKGSSLNEVLSNISGDNIILQLADPSRAGIIVPAEQTENEDVLMLIMPMLLND